MPRKDACKSARDMDNFSSFTDACLMAQNIVNGAELWIRYSLLSSIRMILKNLWNITITELTFPVVGLGIGYPNQEPQLKPRMDMKFRVFENKYISFDNYLKELEDYDEEMQTYYDLRDANNRVDSFSNQVVKKFSNANPKRQEILNIMKKMGFNI